MMFVGQAKPTLANQNRAPALLTNHIATEAIRVFIFARFRFLVIQECKQSQEPRFQSHNLVPRVSLPALSRSRGREKRDPGHKVAIDSLISYLSILIYAVFLSLKCIRSDFFSIKDTFLVTFSDCYMRCLLDSNSATLFLQNQSEAIFRKGSPYG